MKYLGILLVLVLGFALASPIKAYYNEDQPTIEIISAEISGDGPVNETSTPQPISGDEGSGAIEKRNLGMPTFGSKPNGHFENRQSNERLPAQIEAQSLQAPINDPMNPPVTSTDNGSTPEMQEQLQSGETPATTPAASAARGLLSDFLNAKPQDVQQPQAQIEQQNSGVPAENLPTIIEKDKQITPQTNEQQQQQQQQMQAQNQLQPQPQPPQQQQIFMQQQQQPPAGQPMIPTNQQPPPQQHQPIQMVPPQQSPALGPPLTAPTLTQLNDPNRPLSTARTFDSWTNCVGASSGKYGTCKNDIECNKGKGRADGSCMGGFGVCCVMALTCGDKSTENNTFFANPDFPEPSWEARLCEVEVKKKSKSILQVMIEFEEFELAPPNHDGECITDVFQVKLASNRPSPYSLLRICGQNTGQHMYLDVSQIDEPLVLSLATSGGGFPRRWSIRIVQMDDKNFLLAPPGCLQYYTDTVGHYRSFNLGRNLRNLYYAICFRIDNGYSGIRFTSNFFGMNGPQCRRRLPGPNGGHGGPPGRHNISSFEAHPHHLVIPPPGYAPPPPKPRIYPIRRYEQQAYGGGGQVIQGVPPQLPIATYQGQRFKRMAYSEPTERYTRTHHEKVEEKEFKGEHEPHKQHYGSSPQYGGSYGYQQAGYGPPSPYYQQDHQTYGSHPQHYEHPQHHQGKKDEGKESKVWGWTGVSDPFGWGKKDAKQEKMDHKHEAKHEKYESKQGYGHGYGSSAYGPPQQHEGYGYGGGYQGGYGHQGGYGGQGGYGNQGYGHGEYHHKEIDKFGKKYEHLEYKHEKNHVGKESEKGSKWWPSWGKSEDKKDKKEKYFQHHEALFPMMHIPEMPHCEPRFCGSNDVITFPPSGDSIAEMCGNRFNRGHGPKIISGSPLVVYVSNRGANRGSGFDMNYEQVFYIPRPY